MNLDRILGSLLSNPASTGLAGAVAGGLLASGGGRKLGKKALELGGMAAIAGLAYTAWQRHQRGRDDATAGEPSVARLREAGFLPTPRASDDFGTALFRAMVAAARCDGRLDGEERHALFDQIAKLELSEAERAELYAEIESPRSLDQLVASATTRERAIELYTASRLAIEPDTAAERAYLGLLAGRLGLEDDLVASIERELREAPAAPALGA